MRTGVGKVRLHGAIAALLLVFVLSGAGFVVHLLWSTPVMFAVVWVGFTLGRDEGAGRHTLSRSKSFTGVD